MSATVDQPEVIVSRERRGRSYRYIVRVNGRIVRTTKDSRTEAVAAAQATALVLAAAGLEAKVIVQ